MAIPLVADHQHLSGLSLPYQDSTPTGSVTFRASSTGWTTSATSVWRRWVSPFFASPQMDFGYDVTDYEDVAPRVRDRLRTLNA